MGNAEDGFMLRHNPLGIHSLDGADIVIGKTPRHATAVSIDAQDDSSILQGMKAKAAYYDSSLDDSIPTDELEDDLNLDGQMTNLGISGGNDQSVHTANTRAPSAPAPVPATTVSEAAPAPTTIPAPVPNSTRTTTTTATGPKATSTTVPSRAAKGSSFGGVNLDFGKEFDTDFSAELKADLGGVLARKPTISARPMPHSDSYPAGFADMKTSSGPSDNPLLIQRLKSIRKQLTETDTGFLNDSGDYEDDVKRAEGLPDDVLKMIAFSPDSPWLENDLPEDSFGQSDDELSEGQIASGTTSKSSSVEPYSADFQKKHPHQRDHPFWNQTPAELNPFFSAQRNKELAANTSPSVSTLASSFSDIEELKENIPSVAPESELATKRKVDMPPSIEETDPVSENDRGRLFLQINRFANMRGLPIETPRNPKFTLSLDNGLQTVTTEPSPLPAPGFGGSLSAKIGQEFELTVAKDLELVLTIGVSMDAVKPPPRPTAPHTTYKHTAQKSTSSAGSSGSSSTTSNSPIKNMKNLLLRSPRKKQHERFQERELEEKQRRIQKEEEENERVRIQHERNLKEFNRRADVWRDITGPRGEYCRGYVFESHYEKDIYGKARSFAVPLYNEWDKAANGVPKPVCELQVTMMYVPKLYGSEQIPMSMQECQKALETAKQKRSYYCEGFLTQQGGDCGSMWRRRYFTLNNTELTGHHEATKKRRALIHLDKAISVKDTLSDDLWCIYEDRSFQITFEDGEAISFYADTVEARDVWMKALRECVANTTGQHRSWTDLVFEEQELSPRS